MGTSGGIRSAIRTAHGWTRPGAPLGVQQKLMRHAQISTTMNVYGNALMDSKRDANSKVAKLALGQGLSPQNTQPKATGQLRGPLKLGFLGLGKLVSGCGGWI